MITNITAKGLKGLEFSNGLEQKNLFIGPTGSGKTSRAQALYLAINGSIPGGDKRNQVILDHYGDGKKLACGFSINGSQFMRQWATNRKGAVTETFFLDTRKSSKKKYIEAITKAGEPKLFDLHEFFELSDNKKIDWLFTLFPPTEDLDKLDAEISNLSDKLNAKRLDLRDCEKFVQKTSQNRADMELPAGTLAEVSDEIKDLEKTLSEAQESENNLRLEIARETEKRIAKEQEEKARAEEREKAKQEEQQRVESEISKRSHPESDPGPTLGSSKGINDFRPDDWQSKPLIGIEEAPRSIQKIIEAMDTVGCSSCAAKLVAKRELNRFK